MKKLFTIPFVLISCSLFVCSENNFPNKISAASSELCNIYFVKDNAVVSKNGDLLSEEIEFLSPPNSTIIDFCLLHNLNLLIAIQDNETHSYKIIYNNKATKQSIIVDSLPISTKLKLFPSPISDLVAVLLLDEGTISISKLDLSTNPISPLAFFTFQNPYYANDVNIYWQRNDESIIAESYFHLFSIDLEKSTYRLLETPNLIDIIDYEYLLRQGFIIEIPAFQTSSSNTFIRKKWSPSATSFVGVRNDSLFLTNSNNNQCTLIYGNCSSAYFNFNPIWKNFPIEPTSSRTSRLHEIDSTLLMNIIPDNSSVKYTFVKIDNIIPALALNYTHTDYVLDFRYYSFLDSISTGMLKIIEMDYILFYWGLNAIPRSSPWNYFGQPEFKDSSESFIRNYSDFVDKILQLRIQHTDSTILNDFKIKFQRNRDFYVAFSAFIELNDTTIFTDKMSQIFKGDELTNIQHFINDLMTDSSNNRFSVFHDSMYNNELNVYGIYTHPKMELLLLNNNILRIPTWLINF